MPFDNQGWYTKAVNYASKQYRSKRFYAGNRGRLAVVLHITDGSDSRAWLSTSPNSEVSANFLNREEGMYQHVSIHDSAWANGRWESGHTWKGVPDNENPNRYTISIENEGRPNQPISDKQYRQLIELLRDLGDVYPQFREYVPKSNLIGHNEISPISRSRCPGKHFDFVKIARDASRPVVTTRVIGTGPSVTYEQFSAWLKRRKAPIVDVVIERIYQLSVWLDIDPAFVAAIWAHETSQTPGVIGSSDLFRKSNNAGAIRAYGRWPTVSHNGSLWNKYESAQLGLMHLVMHLKQVYGAVGLLDVETIIPVYAPSSDGNKPASYIAAVLRDMKEMQNL